MKYQIYLNQETTDIVETLSNIVEEKPCRVIKDFLETIFKAYATIVNDELEAQMTKENYIKTMQAPNKKKGGKNVKKKEDTPRIS